MPGTGELLDLIKASHCAILEQCSVALFLALPLRILVLLHRGLPLQKCALAFNRIYPLLVLFASQTLKETLQEVIPAKQEQLKQLVWLFSSGPCAHSSIL